MLQAKMHQIYPVSYMLDSAINQCRILPFLGFAGISMGIYSIFVLWMDKKYQAIHTALTSHAKKVRYTFRNQKKHSALMALVYKEWKRFVSSVNYVVNIGIGMIFALIASIACLFCVNMLSDEAYRIIYECRYVVPFLLAMLLTMTCTTSISLSLEGKNLWIIQSLPISRQLLLKGKMAFNVVLLLPAALIGSICMVVGLRLHVGMLFLYLLVSLSMICFSTVIGMCFNLWFPKYQWENETEVLKQGLAVTLGILVNMFLQMFLMGIVFIAGFLLNGAVVVGSISLVFLLLSAGIYYLLMRGEPVIWAE